MFDLACFMSLFNKALCMDPAASRLLRPVTEYSVAQGSISFSCGHWQGMDIARLLLALEQGMQTLEDYIQEYSAIVDYSDLPDCLLIEFFCDGVHQPVQVINLSKVQAETLGSVFITLGSSFTVGVTEEERDITVMVAVKFSRPQAPGHFYSGD
ncbi:Glutamyl-tRNA reductase [Labeo rohita]|uniref:Glutamyl-tRNA reductase n=1 Tax=Labeo rohita TaxID=84645 RepID=A0ABQ8N011_LABRO|nr:Glutamyl-tRNA reductase [Labeo rohita]